LLVVCLIGFGLYFLYLGPRTGKDGEKRPSVVRQSLDRAEDTATSSNIQQIQSAIEIYKIDNDGKPPASLEELKNSSATKGFPPEMWVDSVTKQPLQYDPATGRVSSPSQSQPPAAAPGQSGQPGINLPDMQPKVPAEDVQ
jgi:type II secretory pathway pseudopilin PulG